MPHPNSLLFSCTRWLMPCITGAVLFTGCSQTRNESGTTPADNKPVTSEVAYWLTKGDETAKLQKQNTLPAFTTATNQYPDIEVDATDTFQTIDGFGYTLTGGSAEAISSLNATKKLALLQELFGSGAGSVKVSYLRISIGASDLNTAPFTYDDMPAGETDRSLARFSLAPDTAYLVPLLQEIVAINPAIKILGSPWSAPVWMKDNHRFTGGHLQPKYYPVYAQYFVRYIRAMQAAGITIDAITPQNEPLHGGNNPSMVMPAAEQAAFIKDHLGPAFKKAGLTTKIIIYDHNCDRPDYPLSILNDPAAKAFINGSAFHLYAGDISVLSGVRNAHPDKAIYFTEQYTSSDGIFGNDLKWHVKNVIIGSMRNWSRIALEWNLASNATYEPHTPGGCTICRGAITVENSNTFTRNVSYYIIAHASGFIPPGSQRIASSVTGHLNTVAFKTPDGNKVLIVENDGSNAESFNIKYNGQRTTASLDGGAVGTFVW